MVVWSQINKEFRFISGAKSLSTRDLHANVAIEYNFNSLLLEALTHKRNLKSIVKMPQAQPELKKVRLTPFHPYSRPRYRGPRRMRPTKLEDREGEKQEQDKWTDMILQYLDKRLFVQLNGSRKVIGVLRGYDVRFPGKVKRKDFADGSNRFS